MSEMIERVAKVLFEKDSNLPWRSKHCNTYVYIDRAKIAIEAMREPTEDMLEEMQASLDCVPIDRCEQQAKQVWQNTIDYILK